MIDTQKEIERVGKEVIQLLLEKNRCYGNAAIKPVNIFSKGSAEEQMNTRIDDKLNRIACGQEFGQEDTELDLIGYLILKRVWRNLNEKQAKESTSNVRISNNARRDSKEDKLLERRCTCPDCAPGNWGIPKY